MAWPPRESELPERRADFRCPVIGVRRHGRLQSDDRSVPVEVLDESVGGFAVALEGMCEFRLGEVLWLEIDADHFAVRLVNIDLEDVGVERFEGADLHSRSRLGLMRESDSEALRTLKTKPVFAGWARLRRSDPRAIHWKFVGAAAGFVGALIVVGLLLINVMDRSRPINPLARRHGEPGSKHLPESLELVPEHKFSIEHYADGTPTVRTQSVGDQPYYGPPPVKARDVTPKDKSVEIDDSARRQPAGKLELKPLDEVSPEPAEPSPSRRPEPQYADATVRLAQPEFLLRPEIVEKLGLSPSQRAHLERITREQSARNEQPASGSTDDARLLARGRLSLAVLSAAQREALVRLEIPADAGGEAPEDE